MPKQDFKDVRNRILEQISDLDDREWVARALDNQNEPSLSDRYAEVMAIVRSDLESCCVDVDDLLSTTKATRHWLVHYEPRLKEEAAHGVTLHYVSATLTLAMEAFLLGTLGFAADERLRALQTNLRSAQLSLWWYQRRQAAGRPSSEREPEIRHWRGE